MNNSKEQLLQNEKVKLALKIQGQVLSLSKVANPIPEKVLKLLNKNDITVQAIEEIDEYNNEKTKFTQCTLSFFNSSDEHFCATLIFNDTYKPKCWPVPKYRLDSQFSYIRFERPRLDGISLYRLIGMYQENAEKGVNKLKALAETDKILDDVYLEMNKIYNE